MVTDGESSKFDTYVIAEAGVNHDGDLGKARELVYAAREGGANAVKFQTWLPGELTGRFSRNVAYIEETLRPNEDRAGLSERLRLPLENFIELSVLASDLGLDFLSTPDGFESLGFLVHEVGIGAIKVGSTELNHLQFLRAVGECHLPVILSTGLGTLSEVEEALDTLVNAGGQDLKVTLMQCTSEYPAPDDEMNLRVLETYRHSFGVPVGLSDHSTGVLAPALAVALGASVIEKHITLSRRDEGPDHATSLEVEEFREMMALVRRSEALLGQARKRPTASEERNRVGIRRGLVAAHNLPMGTVLCEEDLACKRPALGLLPKELGLAIGRTTRRALLADEPVGWSDLC